MSDLNKTSWLESLSVYKDIRMLRILLLGSISGFPWVLIASSLSLWLKEEGLSRSTIGWAGLIFGVYAFNYLWAPIIDRIQIPFLTKKLGQLKKPDEVVIIKKFTSKSNPDITYTTKKTMLPTGKIQYSCNCPGVWRSKTRECKHIREMKSS